MDLIDTTFAKIHNIYKDYFWQEKPYEKSVDEFYELKTKIQTILKIYSDESIPLELQVKPEIAEVTKITMWVDMIWNDIFDDDELPLTAAQMNIVGKYINDAKEKIRQQFSV